MNVCLDKLVVDGCGSGAGGCGVADVVWSYGVKTSTDAIDRGLQLPLKTPRSFRSGTVVLASTAVFFPVVYRGYGCSIISYYCALW
jgi:hypothetical protein